MGFFIIWELSTTGFSLGDADNALPVKSLLVALIAGLTERAQNVKLAWIGHEHN